MYKRQEYPSHTIHYGKIIDPDKNDVIDEVLISKMAAPRTYTCEDTVEINCHGGYVTAVSYTHLDVYKRQLYTMAMYDNICKHIHLPVQSGSNTVLEKMNRKYTRENYLERINKIREILPDCAITTDLIAGFCSETEQDHLETLSLLEEVQFDGAFMFQYSERPGTSCLLYTSRCV